MKTMKCIHWLSALPRRRIEVPYRRIGHTDTFNHRQPAHSMMRSAKVWSLPLSLISSSVRGKSACPIKQYGLSLQA